MTDSELSASRALNRARAALEAWLSHPECDEYPDDDATMMADIVADLLLLSAVKGIPSWDTARRAEWYVEDEVKAAETVARAEQPLTD